MPTRSGITKTGMGRLQCALAYPLNPLRRVAFQQEDMSERFHQLGEELYQPRQARNCKAVSNISYCLLLRLIATARGQPNSPLKGESTFDRDERSTTRCTSVARCNDRPVRVELVA